jgi:hypothetical protein
MKFWFYTYKECPKRTSYVTGTSCLVCTTSVLRTGLELELLRASTLGTQTELSSDLLLDLDTLVGLLLLYAMHHS